jgi:hypothetical protein
MTTYTLIKAKQHANRLALEANDDAHFYVGHAPGQPRRYVVVSDDEYGKARLDNEIGQVVYCQNGRHARMEQAQSNA